ncbi:TetR/AcrR family transcriptional regulator [Sphingobium sp. H39-3-25]|uniref:TetR/AcrR family transcriptional regulator n=1 Tax=Sphingobium arseniciresistens TaxID=3030834 RepID=UPI0023B99180|nr:TetR/AcrR family transcriptional regulator [Sphingobium arseniciresistens]
MECRWTSKGQSRREARKEDRRAAILAVAQKSFLELGYAATSMSSIAATMGGSKGTLWSYFPSKEVLFSAVLDSAMSTYRERLKTLLNPGDGLRVTLEGFCRALLDKVTSADALALHRLIQTEGSRIPELGPIFFEHGPMQTHRLLADFIAEHMAKGSLLGDDPLLAARALISLATGGHHQRLMWHVEPLDPAKIEADARFATDVFLRAYGPEQGQGEDAGAAV